MAASAIKIIDADTHLTEPWHLWTSRPPASIRSRVPQVKLREGRMSWVIVGNQSIGTGAHPTRLYPFDDLEGRLGDLSREEREKVLSGNAARLYRIAI